MKANKNNWFRLDNAAKIFPAAKRRRWNTVFRLSVTLTQKIDESVLQLALEKVLPRFPSIAVRLNHGLFWYYLETITKVPTVQNDFRCPCYPMNYSDIKKCAFRVLYYENRIAVEFFHAVTDANGGLVFLKSLASEYISLKYSQQIPATLGVLDTSDLPNATELEDSFLKNEGEVSASRKEATAFKLRGIKELNGFIHVITGIIKTSDLIGKAKSYNVSLTVFLVAVMIQSIIEIQNERIKIKLAQKPVKIMVPVNLRNFFESNTLRNFILYINPGIDPRLGNYSFEEIINSVNLQMKMELDKKNLQAKLTTNVRTEKSKIIKCLPLFIKNFAMKTVYNIVGEKKSCIAISNLGLIKIPSEMEKYVERFDFVLGAQATINNNCGIISYGDKMYINMIRTIRDSVLERKFFTKLVEMNIPVEVESNQK